MQVWIGTSGYTYADWVGPFYPPGTSTGQMFPFYTRRFPLVELNFTFYRPPTPEHFARLSRRAPPGFQFVVKLYQGFSHEHDFTEAVPFLQAVDVFQREGRLLGLLGQYPQRFHYDTAGLEQLDELAKRFEGYPLAIEFRHRSWHRPDVLEWLRERGLHVVSVDAPAIPALYPSGLVQTCRLIYVRFHSRRAGSWYESDKERYDYLYAPQEMQSWVDALAKKRESADRALVLFNNCHRGQSAINAVQLRELLNQAGGFDVVAPFPAAPGSEQGLLF
jgi:uncharacterized protein YecE (DUF72 family)